MRFGGLFFCYNFSMTNKPIRVVFFGTEDISVPTLKALIQDKDYEVVAAVTKPDSERGRGHKLTAPAVKVVAKQNGIKVYQPTKLKETTGELKALQADVGALVAYGKILPGETLEIFPHGIINFHPSMLPVYRGPSPIITAVMNGDSFTGLTITRVTHAMDSGEIYYQEKATIGPDETVEDLNVRFGERGGELIATKLKDIVAGKIQGVPQDDEMAIYCHMITKADGDLDPVTMTARECYNRWRALHAWPKCRIKLGGEAVIITKCEPLDNYMGEDWPDIISCANNTSLHLIEIQNPKSGKRMKVIDYLNGQANK